MKAAMDELERIDSRLFMEANKQEDPRARSPEEIALTKKLSVSERKAMEARIRGLFPRELAVPSDTPSKTGWNYHWKPFNRPI
jgi:large subunit ribosomal protein L40